MARDDSENPSSDSLRSSAITSMDDLPSSSSDSELNARPFLGNSLEENQLVRKLDRRILPMLCLVYLFACGSPSSTANTWIDYDSCIDLDRTNLGNARLLGLPEDALGGDPTGQLFDSVNSAFFVSYVCGPGMSFPLWYWYLRYCRSYFKYRLQCVRSCFPLISGWLLLLSAGAFVRLWWWS